MQVEHNLLKNQYRSEVISLDSVVNINSDLKGPVNDKTIKLEEFASQ